MENIKFINGDVIDEMNNFNDFEFNTVFSDPPYNLGSQIYIDKIDGKPKFKNSAKDFMSKWSFGHDKWELFAEQSFRVLKYGGYCLLFGLDRQLPLIQYYMIKVGFEQMQSLYWYFLSNMPKGVDASKQIDKRLGINRKVVGIGKGSSLKKQQKHNKDLGFRPNEYYDNNNGEFNITKSQSELGSQFEGYKYGQAPFKQVVETILVFRKPTKNKSILDDIINYQNDNEISPSVIDIENNRVPIDLISDKSQLRKLNCSKREDDINGQIWGFNKTDNDNPVVIHKEGRYTTQTFIDNNIELILDEQSGKLQSGSSNNNAAKGVSGDVTPLRRGELISRNDHDKGCSKILKTCIYEQGDYDLYNYNPKVNKWKRNFGVTHLEEKQGGSYKFREDGSLDGKIPNNNNNNHPTVKPINLIQNILNLFKLPIDNQKLLIPFSGSGSEIIGAYRSGYNNITSIELNKDYYNISKLRFNKWKDYKDVDYNDIKKMNKKIKKDIFKI